MLISATKQLQALPGYAPRVNNFFVKYDAFLISTIFRAIARMAFRGIAGTRPGLGNMVKHNGFRVFRNTDPPLKTISNHPKAEAQIYYQIRNNISDESEMCSVSCGITRIQDLTRELSPSASPYISTGELLRGCAPPLEIPETLKTKQPYIITQLWNLKIIKITQNSEE